MRVLVTAVLQVSGGGLAPPPARPPAQPPRLPKCAGLMHEPSGCEYGKYFIKRSTQQLEG